MCSRKTCTNASPSVENVTNTLTPILWFSRFSGINVFEMPAGTAWPKCSALYSFSLCLLYGMMIWFGETFITKKNTSIPIAIFVYALVKYVSAFTTVMSYIVGILNYKKMINFAKRLAHADETLKKFGIEPEYAVSRRQNMCTVATWIIASLLQFVADLFLCIILYNSLYIAILKHFIFEIPSQFTSLIELTFAIKISTVRSRFEKLNALFQNVLENPVQPKHVKHVNKYHNILRKDHSKESDRNRKNLELLLMTSRQLHLELCAITREINEAYGKQLAMVMAAKFIHVTGYSYCFYLFYNEPNILISLKIINSSSVFFNLICNIVMMVNLIKESVAVTSEAQKTTQLAHEIPVTQLQATIIDEIHQFSLQVIQHPLQLTAASLFTLNFAYMRGFIGSVTTYLMILIQNQPNIAAAANVMIDEIYNISALYVFYNTTNSSIPN